MDCDDDIVTVATGLLGERPRNVHAVAGGGNNRIYRIEASNHYALKVYPEVTADGRDRLNAEFGALEFLTKCGIRSIPRSHKIDRKRRYALYEWIDGTAISEPNDNDIDDVVAFVDMLRLVAQRTDAANLAEASESCLAMSDIAKQIERRRVRLAEVESDHVELSRFMMREFDPAYRDIVASAKKRCGEDGTSAEHVLDSRYRTLSPSDFGFHNAIRNRERNLIFYDFEYFGWDDPVKLCADFLLHPGMSLSERAALRFWTGVQAVFAADPDFKRRFDRSFPLFGLRWCMILLNEFLPEGLVRRRYAGHRRNNEEIQATQLMKAHKMLRRAISAKGSAFHEQ